MFCENCGSEIDDDARFCTTCGHVVESDGDMAGEGRTDASDAAGPGPEDQGAGGQGEEGEAGPLWQQVSRASRRSLKRIPVALLIILVTLAVASVAFAAYIVWDRVIVPMIEQQEQTAARDESSEASHEGGEPEEGEPASAQREGPDGQGDAKGEAEAPASASSEVASEEHPRKVWALKRAVYLYYADVTSAEVAFEYDGSGNLVSRTGRISTNFAMDADELEFDGGPGFVDALSYDEHGNETGRTRTGDASAFLMPGTASTTSVELLETDAEGRAIAARDELAESNTWLHETHFDRTRAFWESGLIRSESEDSGSVRRERTYDEDGLLVSCTWPSVSYNTAAAGPTSSHMTLTYERDADGHLQGVTWSTEVADGSEPPTSATYSLVTDENGNVVEMTDERGATIARFEYEEIEATNPVAYARAMRRDFYVYRDDFNFTNGTFS